MTNQTIEALTRRRSQYALGKTLPIPTTEVDALIREAVRQAPSSFNSQTSRALILFGAESDKFWGFVKEALRTIVPAEAFEKTGAKIDSFAAGAGTVLFFEDMAGVGKLQQEYALYADNFPIWSEQSSGMAQLAVWTALAEAGIGASLQHYNPLVDEQVAREWNLPDAWKMRAMMPFGSNEAPIGPKSFMDDAERFVTAG